MPTGLVSAATADLQVAFEARDRVRLAELYRRWRDQMPNPRQVLAEASESELGGLRDYIEAWDDVLRRWIFSEEENSGLWYEVVLATNGDFDYSMLLMNAWWLREVRSPRLCSPSLLPDLAALEALPLELQAKALGRFCATADAVLPLDYEAIAMALAPELRPYFAAWFLNVYLMSPFYGIVEGVLENRRAATDLFAAFHERHDVLLPFMPLLGAAGYRAAYFTESPARFIGALADRILAPAWASIASEEPVVMASGSENGVVLTCWRRNHAVYRCLAPALANMRQQGIRGFFLDGTLEDAERSLPEEWFDADQVMLSASEASSPQEMLDAAASIREEGLDFLFYPEVGISLSTRWLSTQRLARVQAAGFGHPVTTGAAAIDYFVLGAEIANRECYTERLVLLPGIGVSLMRPPDPSFPRSRPVIDHECRFVSMASFDKLNPPLLEAWNAILEGVGPRSHLTLICAVNKDQGPFAEQLQSYFKGTRVKIQPSIPRQECIDLLSEADIYLDSFPYGGYNTVGEAVFCSCPTMTLEGKNAPGRHGPAVIRMLGLPDFLVAHSIEAYVHGAIRLARDEVLRADIRASLDPDRVANVLCHQDIAEHFAAAVSWMREQGPGREGPPVYIEAGQPPRLLDYTDFKLP